MRQELIDELRQQINIINKRIAEVESGVVTPTYTKSKWNQLKDATLQFNKIGIRLRKCP